MSKAPVHREGLRAKDREPLRPYGLEYADDGNKSHPRPLIFEHPKLRDDS